MANISSANAIYKISVPLLSIINVQLEGFDTDSAFNMDEIEITENKIGVDGIKSYGFVYQLFTQNIILQADSPSMIIFETLYQAMLLAKNAYAMEGIIEQPSVNRSYILTSGTLQNYKPMSDAQRVLQPRQFTINWGIVEGAPT